MRAKHLFMLTEQHNLGQIICQLHAFKPPLVSKAVLLAVVIVLLLL